MTGAGMAAAAQALVGTRFRLNGRDPQVGLDCLGVLGAALGSLGRAAPLPGGISLRRCGVPDVDRTAQALGLVPASGAVAPGDVLLVRCSPIQLHLLIASAPDRFVHAHAGLGRVVIGARDPDWRILGHWRLPEPD